MVSLVSEKILKALKKFFQVLEMILRVLEKVFQAL